MSRAFVTPPGTLDRHGSLFARGVPLEAAIAFAPKRLLNRLYQAKADDAAEIRKAAQAKDARWLSVAAAAVLTAGSIAESMFRKSDITNWLALTLAHKKFFAYGDRLPLNPKKQPELIPHTYFGGGAINLGASTLRYHNVKFFDVRILRPAWIRKALKTGVSEPTKIGRPSLSHEIDSAIEELHLKNPQFAAEIPGGLGDQTIWRRIRNYVQNRK